MLTLAFQWPNTLLVVVLIGLVVSTFVPWLDSIRLRLSFVPIPATLATITWLGYEFRLEQLARVGDPLIRLDLALIYPLLAATWISTTFAVGSSIKRKSDVESPPS